MKKLLTIITVCYNSELTIERTIKSVINQIDDDVEYLIIDGKSRDNTLNIIEKYYKKIRVISEKDEGIYDAMNKGIKNAKGDWICFINSDDWLEDGVISKIKKILICKEIDCIYGDVRRIRVMENKVYIKEEKANTNLCELERGMLFSHQSFFVNKRVFEKIGGFDIEFNIAADWDFILRAYVNGFRFKYVEGIISNFTVGGVCGKSHIMQRHRVRKNNKVINIYDKYMIKEICYKVKRALLKRIYKNKYIELELRSYKIDNTILLQ